MSTDLQHSNKLLAFHQERKLPSILWNLKTSTLKVSLKPGAKRLSKALSPSASTNFRKGASAHSSPVYSGF